MSNCLTTQECWRPIVGAEGYYSISSLGRVRSEPLSRPTPGRQRGRLLSRCLDTKGYPIVRICLPEGPSKTRKVHRLVAEVFLGPAEDRQVNHINGDKTDNRVENLEYVTCKENIRHCWETGLHGVEHLRGESNSQARLKEHDVRLIRTMHPYWSLGRLARTFDVSKQAIAAVVKRQTWKHI